MKKLPVGIQSFREIRNGGYLYVDKTEHIHNLVTSGKYYFLSRPRRFGKSLLVNTLAELFKGKKELFKGLWIEDKWDWEIQYPVIQIGFSSMGYKTAGLEPAIYRTLKKQAESFGVSLVENGYDTQFKELILALFEKYGPVVILIDEYDKPIIDFIEEPGTAKAQRNILKTFYSVLKDLDDYLRMVFITGVSKFSRTSIFSELNNLTDLTMHPKYPTMLGYTQAELESYFDEHLEEIAGNFGGKESLLGQIRDWYNGYSWDGIDKVYNPFSVLSFFHAGAFKNFWFETGTPTFLVKLLKKHEVYDLDGMEAPSAAFGSYELDNLSYITLLFQTGYITIKKSLGMDLHELGYPNKEVRQSLLQYLISEYRGLTPDVGSTPAMRMALALSKGNLDAFILQINALLASIPYDWHQKSEAYYHTIMHLAFSLIGVHIQSEIHTAKGRLDSVIHTEKTIYVVEFKVDKSADKALIQVEEKGYATPYLGKGRPVVAIGVDFSTEKKEVADWGVETLG